jgi:lysozyme family protein
MPTADELRNMLMQAVNELTSRGMTTNDTAELAAIEREIEVLNRRIARLDQMLLLDAAAAVAESANALAEVVKSARTGPFDRYVAEMTGLIERMRVAHEQTMNQQLGSERGFPKTEEAAAEETEAAAVPAFVRPESAGAIERAAPAAPPPPAASPAAAGALGGAGVAQQGRPEPAAPRPKAAAPHPPAAQLPAIVRSTNFSDLKEEYEAEWACCEAHSDKHREIEAALGRARAGRQRYEQVAAHFGGMPWQFLAVMHGMEAGFRFDRHLHNGDPLTGRTVRVPAGRPRTGTPPFSWEESAQDAMALMGYDRVTDWSLANVLYLLEKYNGFGYRRKGLRTPYLWSYSNLYEKGRYVADGVFDPEAVSRQCGAATLLKKLL